MNPNKLKKMITRTQRTQNPDHLNARIPLSLLKHKAVATIESGYEQHSSDYLFEAGLKDGWVFTRGRMEGCQWAFFNTIADFNDAKPKQR